MYDGEFCAVGKSFIYQHPYADVSISALDVNASIAKGICNFSFQQIQDSLNSSESEFFYLVVGEAYVFDVRLPQLQNNYVTLGFQENGLVLDVTNTTMPRLGWMQYIAVQGTYNVLYFNARYVYGKIELNIDTAYWAGFP